MTNENIVIEKVSEAEAIRKALRENLSINDLELVERLVGIEVLIAKENK